MTTARRAFLLGAGLMTAAASLAACGSGSQVVVRPPASAASQTATTTPSSTPTVTIRPRISVSPSRNLRDGQLVHVDARGFGPNQSLVTIECADLGSKTGAGDCNIVGLSAISVSASGTGSTTFTVRKGPFGSNSVRCTSRRPCIVSVSQATADPTQTASARISFG